MLVRDLLLERMHRACFSARIKLGSLLSSVIRGIGHGIIDMVEQASHTTAYKGECRYCVSGNGIAVLNFGSPLSQVLVALGLQISAVVACFLRSPRLQDMPSSPEGALILLNLVLCILGPVLIRQAWRWHIS